MSSPADMVLHSAAHLFHDGELEHGLRDLVDIDALIGQFAGQHRFFETLMERAEELDLGRPLYYALRYCRAFLRTPIPDEMLSRAAEHGTRSITIRAIMGVVVLESIGSVLEDRPGIKAQVSQFAMYLRSHYLRMPMHLLLPHLLRKQFVADPDGGERMDLYARAVKVLRAGSVLWDARCAGTGYGSLRQSCGLRWAAGARGAPLSGLKKDRSENTCDRCRRLCRRSMVGLPDILKGFWPGPATTARFDRQDEYRVDQCFVSVQGRGGLDELGQLSPAVEEGIMRLQAGDLSLANNPGEMPWI